MSFFQQNKIERVSGSGILSATRPKEAILKTGFETKTELQTRLRQKSIIRVYVDENKYYVEHSAAYALGLIKTRAIMMEQPKLVEITSDMHSMLKVNSSIKIEYVQIEAKQPLKVYVDGTNYCIDSSAAYALGFSSVEEFNNSESNYYYITERILNELKEKYKIELHSLNLEQYSSDKNL